jgi:hypothetical protein
MHQRFFIDVYPPISGHPNSGADGLVNQFLVHAGSCSANDWMRPYRDRMPVILDWRDADVWLQRKRPGSVSV